MAFTKSTVATNNISNLANKPLESAPTLKQKFDQYGIDDKARFNALIDELEATTGTSGAENIGSKTISGVTGNTPHAQITDVKAQLDARNAENVKLTGNQTIAGTKTFTSSPVVPVASADTQAPQKKYVDDENLKDVHLTGNQTVAGIKTFSSSPIVPTPTTDFQASTRKFVTDSVMGIVVPTLPDGAVSNEYLADENKMLGVAVQPIISYGQNLITNTHLADAYPDITFQGKHYTNPLGSDGNCESTTPFTATGCTLSLDTSKKVFGANALKITLTATTGIVSIPIGTTFNVSGYALISAYLDRGTATNITLSKDATGGGVIKSVISTDVIPTRQGVLCQPSDNNAGNLLKLTVTGSIGQVAYVDGIMDNEISSVEYVMSVATVMAIYPYVDSYACLQNPAVEVIHDNMVRNGNGEEGVAWWGDITAVATCTNPLVALSSGGFSLTAVNAYDGKGVKVPVKPNTDYYVSATCTSDARVAIYNEANVWMETANGTFNSGNNSFVYVLLQKATAGAGTFSNVHLIPGTVAPTAYKPQRREQCVIEGKFATGDTVRLKDGKLEGSLLWEHKTLYGRDWAWDYHTDSSGYKIVKTTLPTGYVPLTGVTTKYDGKILKDVAGVTSADTVNLSTVFYVGMADTDTGWAEAIAPNADEVKAYMNGWKANANNGTRYTSWVSVVDGSAPATNTIAYVMANVAPLYKGYQLHYKLANPKAVNEYNCRLKGTLPKLENGMNVVNVDAGLVIGEVANVNASAGSSYINGGSTTKVLNIANEFIKSVFKNRAWDMSLWTVGAHGASNIPVLGNTYVFTVDANVDPKAQYTVDYTILRTQAPVVGTPSMEYLPGVTEKVQPMFQNDPKIWGLPSAPSNDFGYDGDGCIYPGGIKTKVKGVWM